MRLDREAFNLILFMTEVFQTFVLLFKFFQLLKMPQNNDHDVSP